MAQTDLTQGIITFFQEDYLSIWIESFLIDRKAQNLSEGTLQFYRKKLKLFSHFCDSQAITQITQITPNTLRQFLFYLGETNHNPGGVHAFYRAIRAFLKWWEQETEPDDWRNPIDKVKAPRVAIESLEPVDLGDVSKLLKSCTGDSFTDIRDRAVILFLLDTGVRANELISIDISDIRLSAGSVLIRVTKNKKTRTVYMGKKCRKAVRDYLKGIPANPRGGAWLSRGYTRLGYDGLRAIITRRSRLAGVPPPQLHSFRRAFAINMLRAGVDIYSLQELMGHSSLQMLQRYLKLVNSDLRIAHAIGSPVDRLL